MASPQKENGYVAIATELWEAMCRIRIPGEARQVFDALIRKTYGFNKKQDRIASSQIAEVTGLHRQTINKAIRRLLSMNLITQMGSPLGNIYAIQKDHEKWAPIPKRTQMGSVKKRTQVGSKRTHKGSKANPKARTQKTITNNNNQGASQSDAAFIVQVIDAFEEINPTFKRWYANTSQRAAIDRMLVEHGLDLVLKVVALLPQTNSKPYFPTITTPIQLETDWAKLRYRLEQEKNKTISKGRGIA